MEGLNRQGRIPFAAVVDQDVRLSLLSHRFLHQFYGVSPHLWQLFHNLGVRFRSFLRGFIGHLERRQEAQDCEGSREAFLFNAILLEPKGYGRTFQSA